MRLLRSARWLLLALIVMLIPVSSHAGVFISVNFSPPPLPVYDQPPCPEPGLMWMPGYWAYGPDGYYWVPGAWVPAPYEGALWTPPYWGWSGGQYVFHDGYWGPHVGYYGGIDYGFGYFGIGFAGGEWRGHDFFYNTAVMHVDRGRIHGVFEDRGRMERGFVDRNSRVSFSGGPGGIRHDPRPEERFADRDHHMGRTTFQAQHDFSARGDHNAYVRNNGGRPQNLTADRPLGRDSNQPRGNGAGWGGPQNNARPMQPGNNQGRGGTQNNASPQSNQQRGNGTGWGGPQNNSRPMQPGNNQGRSGAQNNANPQSNVQRSAPAQQQRPAAQSRPNPGQSPAAHSAPSPRSESKPRDDEHRH